VMFLHGKSRVDVLLNLTGKHVSFLSLIDLL
jgi:hypothetical protein